MASSVWSNGSVLLADTFVLIYRNRQDASIQSKFDDNLVLADVCEVGGCTRAVSGGLQGKHQTMDGVSCENIVYNLPSGHLRGEGRTLFVDGHVTVWSSVSAGNFAGIR